MNTLEFQQQQIDETVEEDEALKDAATYERDQGLETRSHSTALACVCKKMVLIDFNTGTPNLVDGSVSNSSNPSRAVSMGSTNPSLVAKPTWIVVS